MPGRDLRLEEGIRVFQAGRGSSEAAVAGLPRAVFLQALMDRGIIMLDGPLAMAENLKALAQRLGDKRLGEIARTLPQSQL